MKTERDKVKKKVWEKPRISNLKFSQTLDGDYIGTAEIGIYTS